MEEYYRQRAEEYEEIYHRADPVRRAELKLLMQAARDALRGRRVLEVACGTGYWTQIVSQTASAITATDSVEEVLSVARRKTYYCPVTLQLGNAYSLSFKAGAFEGGLANFWFSHIPKHRIDHFIAGFHRTLRPQSSVCWPTTCLSLTPAKSSSTGKAMTIPIAAGRSATVASTSSSRTFTRPRS